MTQFTKTTAFNIPLTWCEPSRDDASGIRTIYLSCGDCAIPIRLDVAVADITGDELTRNAYCPCGCTEIGASIVGLSAPAPPPPAPEPAPAPPPSPPGQNV